MKINSQLDSPKNLRNASVLKELICLIRTSILLLKNLHPVNLRKKIRLTLCIKVGEFKLLDLIYFSYLMFLIIKILKLHLINKIMHQYKNLFTIWTLWLFEPTLILDYVWQSLRNHKSIHIHVVYKKKSRDTRPSHSIQPRLRSNTSLSHAYHETDLQL